MESLNKNISLIIIVLLFPLGCFAQSKYTISGKITDNETGEDLIGAAIKITNTATGAVTNIYGFYSLTISKGEYNFTVSYLGYKSVAFTLSLTENTTKNIALFPESTNLQEVVVSTERADDNITSAKLGTEKLNMKQLQKLPVLMGEKDVLKSLQLLPGISSSSEGGAGFSVRGGSSDQNLILLDEAPVYSSSHLLGFFSVFNYDAIKDVTVYKSGIPASYGGRGSSVLDIHMKEGNVRKMDVSGGIGLISSRLTVEGPLVKDKMSFIISGRRSYADLMAKASGFAENDMDLYFYDLNAKINYTLNNSNRFYLSGYFGKDNFGLGDLGSDWGNSTGTLRWNHLFSPKIFSNTTFIFSDYRYSFNFYNDMKMDLGIQDYGLKQDFTWFVNPQHNVKFGVQSTYHIFEPGQLISDNEGASDVILDKKYGLESSVYISDKASFGNKFNAEYGLRLASFLQIGPGWTYNYNSENMRIDSTYYSRNETAQSYLSLEPRVSLGYSISKSTAIKASYNRTVQNLHLLSNSTSNQPNDTWLPSTTHIKPLIVNQISAGYFKNFFNNKIEFSAEAYYKTLDNVVDYEDGADLALNEDIEAYILSGEGRSYGLELYLSKKTGLFSGWISYTLSKSENKIDGINNNSWYNSRYDKIHNISIVGSYNFNSRTSISATWTYSTGNAVTFPSGKYSFDGKFVPYYSERNAYRMPDSHRLDLNLHLEGKEGKKFSSSWDFSIYNAYNRYNAYTITFRENEDEPGVMEAVRTSLFGIVPSITWNFNF
jgi:hypothetical protein